MISTFDPRLDVLPRAQLALWPALAKAVDLGFVLYGGTAIALRLGHRSSVDFDFFCEQPLDREAIGRHLPFMARSTSLQDKEDTWTVLFPGVDRGSEPVKLSLFGSIAFGRVGEPDVTADGVVQVASIEDLMATTLKVVLQRAESKDYCDIAAMLRAGASLPHGLAAARTMFGPNYQPSESLKALVYFDDGDLKSLTPDDRKALVDAVATVRDLPDVGIVAKRLTAAA